MEEQKSLFELDVDDRAGRELTELSRWTKLFGIIVLSLLALCVLLVVFSWNRIEYYLIEESGAEGRAMMGMLTVFIVIGMAIGGIMMFFLVRSANRIRTGLHNRDQQMFNNGLGDLKTFFVFIGVFGILSLLSNLFSLIPG